MCLALLFATMAAVSSQASDLGSFKLPGGAAVRINETGIGTITSRNGRQSSQIAVFMPRGHTAAGVSFAPSKYAIIKQLVTQHNALFGPGRVIMVLAPGVTVLGAASPTKHDAFARKPQTNDGRVNDVLRSLGARTLTPLVTAANALSGLATVQRGPHSVDIANSYLVDITSGVDPQTAAAALRKLSSVRYAEPDWYVTGMSTNVQPVPSSIINQVQRDGARYRQATVNASSPLSAKLPTNFGVVSSLQSYLNANGVDLYGAYAEIAQRFTQLPGTGEIITNVSVGDLTDQEMANNGDPYVRMFGPTTIIQGAQRYLDIPSFPLIPTFTSNHSGVLNPLGSTEFQDPFNGEVLLDFSMMAPLPHDRQRPGAVGSFLTDLIGIAPGAQYRLVIPEQPTISQIAVALLAAAQQQPHPNVISASLGFGFDTVGFPGRYLEEDPLAQSIIASIVQNYGIVVCISAGDGTRLFTPAAVGPDGGSAATDLATDLQPPTSTADDAFSTISGRVIDSGAIAVGGTTTDDIFVAPPQGHTYFSNQGTFVETRWDGGAVFASGFGQRVNVSGPSDNIPSFIHVCDLQCNARSVIPVLNAGTSASAPMTAAAAAVVLQAGRLTGQTLHPQDIRALLTDTGRAVPVPQIADRRLNVGPQIDVTAAVERVFAHKSVIAPQIIRLGVALRQNLANLGAQFVDLVNTDNIPLNGPPLGFQGILSGQNTVSPMTFAPDIVGIPDSPGLRYQLRVGNEVISRSRVARLLPAQILAAAHLPLESTTSRSLTVTYEIFNGSRKLAGISEILTFGPTDGTYLEALAPVVPAVVPLGQPVLVHYDIRDVRGLISPGLAVSSIDHWSPLAAPLFRITYQIPLANLSGTVSVPASAFAAGEGVYGIGIIQQQFPDQIPTVGEFSPLRIGEGDLDERPEAPTFSIPGQTTAIGATASQSGSHIVSVQRAAPGFDVHYNVSQVRGAVNAIIEISAPAPTLFGLFNTFTNQNGSTRDSNGVDSPSVKYLPQSGTSGVAHLNAASLGLQSSDMYTVRVLPANGAKVVGQASAVSTLQFNDGLSPGGQQVFDFDVKPNGRSTVSTVFFDGFGNPLESFLFPYSTSSGTYSAPFASDFSGATVFQTVGLDSKTQTNIVLRSEWFGTHQFLESYDGQTGQLLKVTPVEDTAKLALVGARLDAERDRVALLGFSTLDGSDQMVTLTPSTMALGAPIALDVQTPSGANYGLLDLDASTGKVFVGVNRQSDNCVVQAGGIGSVNLTTRVVAPYSPAATCITGIVTDNQGKTVYLVGGGNPFTGTLLIPPGRFQAISQSTLEPGPIMYVQVKSALLPAYDSLHHLLVSAFFAAPDYIQNNNATGVIGVINPASGQLIESLNGFNFARQLFPVNTSQNMERGVQLDPTSRRGWTYAPNGTQIQEFKY